MTCYDSDYVQVSFILRPNTGSTMQDLLYSISMQDYIRAHPALCPRTYSTRLYVLYMLPKLLFLDSTSVTPMERLEAKRRGQYCRTARLVKVGRPVCELFS